MINFVEEYMSPSEDFAIENDFDEQSHFKGSSDNYRKRTDAKTKSVSKNVLCKRKITNGNRKRAKAVTANRVQAHKNGSRYYDQISYILSIFG